MKKVDCIVAAPHFLTMEGGGVGYRADHAMAVDRGKIIGIGHRDDILKEYLSNRSEKPVTESVLRRNLQEELPKWDV